jgi:hypothetical protein
MTDKLTPHMVHLVENLASDWRQLDARIEAAPVEIEELAHADEAAVRLMSVPGIGPIVSSATVADIAKGDVFTKGRGFDNKALLTAKPARRPPWNKGKLIGAKPPLRGRTMYGPSEPSCRSRDANGTSPSSTWRSTANCAAVTSSLFALRTWRAEAESVALATPSPQPRRDDRQSSTVRTAVSASSMAEIAVIVAAANW